MVLDEATQAWPGVAYLTGRLASQQHVQSHCPIEQTTSFGAEISTRALCHCGGVFRLTYKYTLGC